MLRRYGGANICDYEEPVDVIRHDYKCVQGDIREMVRGIIPSLPNDRREGGTLKDLHSLMGACSYKVGSRGCVIMWRPAPCAKLG